jgi:hypothetical protein
VIIPIESSTDAKIEEASLETKENTNSEEKKKKQYKIEFNKDELKKKSKLSVNETSSISNFIASTSACCMYSEKGISYVSQSTMASSSMNPLD